MSIIFIISYLLSIRNHILKFYVLILNVHEIKDMDDASVKNMKYKLTVSKIVIVFLLTFLIKTQYLNKVFLSIMHCAQTKQTNPKNSINIDINKLRKTSILKIKIIVILMFNPFFDQVLVLIVLVLIFTNATSVT